MHVPLEPQECIIVLIEVMADTQFTHTERSYIQAWPHF